MHAEAFWVCPSAYDAAFRGEACDKCMSVADNSMIMASCRDILLLPLQVTPTVAQVCCIVAAGAEAGAATSQLC